MLKPLPQHDLVKGPFVHVLSATLVVEDEEVVLEVDEAGKGDEVATLKTAVVALVLLIVEAVFFVLDVIPARLNSCTPSLGNIPA